MCLCFPKYLLLLVVLSMCVCRMSPDILKLSDICVLTLIAGIMLWWEGVVYLSGGMTWLIMKRAIGWHWSKKFQEALRVCGCVLFWSCEIWNIMPRWIVRYWKDGTRWLILSLRFPDLNHNCVNLVLHLDGFTAHCLFFFWFTLTYYVSSNSRRLLSALIIIALPAHHHPAGWQS